MYQRRWINGSKGSGGGGNKKVTHLYKEISNNPQWRGVIPDTWI